MPAPRHSWGFDYLPSDSSDPHSAKFVAAIDAITTRLQARGSFTCSAGARCDYLSENGRRYVGLPQKQANGCYG